MSVTLLSQDFDGEAFEGKGIDTAVLYSPAAAQGQESATAAASKTGAASAKYAPVREGEQVFAFEVPFTLLSKYLVPLPSLVAILPVTFTLCRPIFSEPPLAYVTLPHGPPPKRAALRSCFLRAPPAFPLA